MYILGLQPIPGDPKDNGVAAMLDDKTFCLVIHHGRHAIVVLEFQGLVTNQEFRNIFVTHFNFECISHFLFSGFNNHVVCFRKMY